MCHGQFYYQFEDRVSVPRAMTHNKKSGNSRLRLLVPLNEYSNSAESHSTRVYQTGMTEDFPEEAKQLC